MNTSIGQQLRQAREARSLTIEQAAQMTHMRQHYLQAMEAWDLGALPSPVQARGFLRAYASFLGLEYETLLAGTSIDSASTGSALAASTSSASTGSAQAVAAFSEIGEQLKHRRELLGLTLDDVERHTHLRRPYLQALEAGQLELLPSPVQGRGMLKNYAGFLGLDAEALLLRFAEGLQAGLAAKQEIQGQGRPSPKKRKPLLPPALRHLFSNDILIGGMLAVVLIVVVIWGAIRIFAMRSNQVVTPTPPSIAEVLLAPPTPSITPTPAPPTPTSPLAVLPGDRQQPTGTVVPLAPPGDVQEGVLIYVTVLQRAWMRAVVDGKIEFEGRVIPGSAYSFAGDSAIELLTGNGAALQVFYNQQDLGALGGFGQVVGRVFTPQGILTPTPTIPPTPTVTPLFTPTMPIPLVPGGTAVPPLP